MWSLLTAKFLLRLIQNEKHQRKPVVLEDSIHAWLWTNSLFFGTLIQEKN